MTDNEFIFWLCRLINDLITGGELSENDFIVLEKELKIRDIDYGEVFGY